MGINLRALVVIFASLFLLININNGLVGFHTVSDSEVTTNNGHEQFPDGHEIFPDDHEQFPDGAFDNIG